MPYGEGDGERESPEREDVFVEQDHRRRQDDPYAAVGEVLQGREDNSVEKRVAGARAYVRKIEDEECGGGGIRWGDEGRCLLI